MIKFQITWIRESTGSTITETIRCMDSEFDLVILQLMGEMPGWCFKLS